MKVDGLDLTLWGLSYQGVIKGELKELTTKETQINGLSAREEKQEEWRRKAVSVSKENVYRGQEMGKKGSRVTKGETKQSGARSRRGFQKGWKGTNKRLTNG